MAVLGLRAFSGSKDPIVAAQRRGANFRNKFARMSYGLVEPMTLISPARHLVVVGAVAGEPVSPDLLLNSMSYDNPPTVMSRRWEQKAVQ
jgi:hypothetical protein